MTCKYLYQNAGCNCAERIIQKNGVTYYSLCRYDDDEDKCPYYEEKQP